MTEDIIARILASKKYSGLCQDTIRRVAEDACGRYKKAKDAEKAARETLHGITGAFMSADELKRAREYMAGGCMAEALKLHSSTRERMPLDAFYDRLFSYTGTPESVLDIACGLNPYYLGSVGIGVTGLDINAALMDAINDWARASGAPVTAHARDVLSEGALPDGEYDLALIMKLLPVLENQRKGSAIALLRSITAGRMVVTFPTRTLGGRKVGMDKHYAQWFEGILTDEFSVAHQYIINDELVYIIERGT
jgi:16S rRNA (guanine(1405)-N(7))-methyltransferase